MPYKPKER